MSSTTIQISTGNRDALVLLAQVMQARHPELWDKLPSYSAAIGYALTNDLSDVLPQILPDGWS